MRAIVLKLSWSMLIIAVCQFPRLGRAAQCSEPSADIGHRIESYLSQRVVSGNSVKVSVVSVTVIPETCYRKVTVALSGAHKDNVMYLSPDERFLAPALYDLSVDPQKEVARIAVEVEKSLLEGEYQKRIVSTKLRIVEFVDFECPYCKQVAEWYEALPEKLKSKTALIFKHLPLEQHPWARTAAIYAACAGSQSSEALEHVAKFFFLSQDNLTAENILQETLNKLSGEKSLNLKLLAACVSNGEGAKVMDSDIEIAHTLNVTGTPTVFINGKRILPLHSAIEFERLLERELAGPVASAGPVINEGSAH